MADDNDSSNDSGSNQSEKEQLAAEKSRRYVNDAGTKEATSTTEEKAGGKDPEGGEAPPADAQSIPSSVDPNASPNSADSDSSCESNSSEDSK